MCWGVTKAHASQIRVWTFQSTLCCSQPHFFSLSQCISTPQALSFLLAPRTLLWYVGEFESQISVNLKSVHSISLSQVLSLVSVSRLVPWCTPSQHMYLPLRAMMSLNTPSPGGCHYHLADLWCFPRHYQIFPLDSLGLLIALFNVLT